MDKTTKKYKMVIRDIVLGKVLFNVALVQNMSFSDVKVNPKKTTGSIFFSSIRDADVGKEMFSLKATVKDAQALLTKLRECVTSA